MNDAGGDERSAEDADTTWLVQEHILEDQVLEVNEARELVRALASVLGAGFVEDGFEIEPPTVSLRVALSMVLRCAAAALNWVGRWRLVCISRGLKARVWE